MFGSNSRPTFLIEINPYQILTAKLSRPDEGPVVLERAAEFDRQDEAGLRQWLDENFARQRNWVPAIGSFAQPEVLLQRDSIEPRKLPEPDYLINLAREHSKIENAETWKFHAISPLDGTAMLPEGAARPGLLCGVSLPSIHQVQQRLLDHRLLPYRLEIGILSLLGAISEYKARRGDKRATVVVVIEQEHTVAYILGKEGMHTPGPVRHGFASVVQAARKEFGIDEAEAARARLAQPDADLQLRAARLVRAIGRDLKPLVDSYEMTTGQPVGEIYCAYLPPNLAWMAEPLAQMVGRALMAFDCQEWLPTVNLQAGPKVRPFAAHWLGILSLIAEAPGAKPAGTPREDDPYKGPWHIDCRLSTHLPSTKQIRRRLLNIAVATAVAVSAVTFTFWQLYAIRSLGADATFWDQKMAANQKLFGELNQDTKTLNTGATRLDYARDLMAASFHTSDFILNLGRSLPPHMRIDRIETNATGLVISGGLGEPSEQASRTLDRYVDELHRSPAIGPLFASISLTSLQRETDSDALAFEIAFKLKSTQP